MASLPNAALAANEPARATRNSLLNDIAAIFGVDAPGRHDFVLVDGPAGAERIKIEASSVRPYGVNVVNLRSEDDALAERFVIDRCGLTPRPANDNVPWTVRDIPGAGQASALPCVDPTTWEGVPVPEREWLIEDVIPSRTVTLLSGDGGVGKSLLALQIAVATALGCSTAGLEPTPGRVMVIAAEDEEAELHRRVVDIVTHHRQRLADLSALRLYPMADRDALLAAPDQRGSLAPTPTWHFFAQAAREFRPSLIVLDTSADLFGGDEIKRAQVRQFVAMLRSLAMELGCAVILLSHPSVAGIASGSGTSGSTAWNNSVRSRLYMEREPQSKDGSPVDPNARLLRVMKANYGQPGAEYRLRWNEGVFVNSAVASCPLVARAAEQHVDGVFLGLLAKMNRQGMRLGVSTGTNYAPSRMAQELGAKGLTKRQLEAAMRRLLDADTIRVLWEGPPSRQRQKLVLASEDFSPR